MDSQAGTVTRTYDGLDRMLSETTPQGSVGYTYDDRGRRTSMTVAGQPVVNYSYDSANRLTQITQGTSSVSFAYDSAGRRTTLTLPNGIVISYNYDAASQLTGLTYTLGANVLGNLTYAYDEAGRRTSLGGTWARTGLPQPLSSASYNAANQLTQWGAPTLSYDANGNLLSDGTDTYTWNARNQLASISGANTATFQYNAFGRRARKTIDAATTEFVYDGFNPVQEKDGAVVIANLLTGLGVDEYFTRTDIAWQQNFLTDGLGSTLALTDATGLVATEYTYAPFGQTTVSGAATTNSFHFTGRENDGTGLYYYRARYYNASISRFISQDPIGFAGGSNLYGYVSNSPVNFTDPFGLKPEEQPCPNGPGSCDYPFDPYSYPWPPWAMEPPSPGQPPCGNFINCLLSGFPVYGNTVGPFYGPVAVDFGYIYNAGQSDVFIFGLGPGVASTPIAVNGGPLIVGDLANAEAILGGWSWSGGAQATPNLGWQSVWNQNGALGGPTWGGPPGVQLSYTHNWVIHLPW